MDERKAVGEEYIEEWKNPRSGAISYYCSLCGCQFDSKLIVMHAMGRGHRQQYQAFKDRETPEDRLIYAKYMTLCQSKEEYDAVNNLVVDCEKALKLVSDAMEHSPGVKSILKKSSSGDKDKDRCIVGVMRCGLLASGLLMAGELNVELVLLTRDKPSETLLNKVIEDLPAQLKAVNSKKEYSITPCVEEAGILVSVLDVPRASCLISMTSALMRKHPFQYYNETAPPDPMDVLPRAKCEEALRNIRRARWYEAKASTLPYCDLVMRVFRDLSNRIPTWSTINVWTAQLLVQKCLSAVDTNTLSPALAVRYVFEAMASGILHNDSPGLYDPCEREPMDVSLRIPLQEREQITASAQHALRLIAFGEIHKVVGMPKSSIEEAEKQIFARNKRAVEDDGDADRKKSRLLALAMT